ncbi:hypothetical protein VTK73DRAFT_4310 [Phialemonium thermophilum]|uniref:Methyltransferase domain-containing protein n=1 Tax=Phialemonium thermophilum TaxID=223376 RepID=A0ABR3WUE0_9PEZI
MTPEEQSMGDLYPRLLDRLKAGDRFLDVGCCLGQDIRKLVYDGVPGENLVGAELNAGFIDVGYELFGDRDTLRAQFVVANVLEEDAPVWKDLHSQFDVVQLGMILHLFSWEEQVKVFEHAIKLLKPGKKGVSIIGQAVGHLLSEAHPANRKNTFRHNAESFKRLIDQVSTKTGTQWKVEASVDEGLSIYDGKRTWDDPNTRRLLFEVERV